MTNTRKQLAWKLTKMLIWTGAACLLVLAACNWWMIRSAQGRIFSRLEDIEPREVALVLGTSSSSNGKTQNPFFTNRIQAAADLYFAGKVKHIIVSGDNHTARYNEPRDMRKALRKLGVPDSCITMDFAGLRTLDSVVRSKRIFQQKRLIIVSQEFHNYRALYIAAHHGIDAIAYNAAHPSMATPRTLVREFLARPRAMVDLYVLDAQPRYLGDKIDIHLPQP